MSDRWYNRVRMKGCLKVKRAALIPDLRVSCNEGHGKNMGTGREQRREENQAAHTLTGPSNYFYIDLRITTV